MADTPLPGAARSDGIATPVSASLWQRAIDGVRYVLTGQAPTTFMGPLNPLPPVAQEEVRGRMFDYPVGINTVTTPRSTEAISFTQLRALADNYDLLRLVIETRKDQLAKLEWHITPRDAEKEPGDDCKTIQDFLQFPDREHGWDEWLRALVEDMLVIDAATIYPRKTRGGQIYSLDLMDGATIKRVIGVDGRTPMAPDVAYQQVIKGLPAADYSADELVYRPRNVRSSKIYGFSPVEQVVMTVNIGIRRQLSQLARFTKGSTPDLILAVPESWNPDQTKQFQSWWNGLLEGNLEAKRGTMFVPNGLKVIDAKEGILFDEFDQWLARVICYAFSVENLWAIKQMNRATAETSREQALAEGLAPLQRWIKRTLDYVLAKHFARPDLQFSWQDDEAVSPLERAQIDQIYLSAKVLTDDEVRKELGLDPLTAEQRERLNPPMPAAFGGEPGAPGEKPFGGKPAAPDEEDATKAYGLKKKIRMTA